MYYDVFYPRSGETICCVRFVFLAKCIAWLYRADYAPQGEGWVE